MNDFDYYYDVQGKVDVNHFLNGLLYDWDVHS